jgi:hypothetical protein
MRWALNSNSSIGKMTSRKPPHKLREQAITSVVRVDAFESSLWRSMTRPGDPKGPVR